MRSHASKRQVGEDIELQICNEGCVLRLLGKFDCNFHTLVWKLTEILSPIRGLFVVVLFTLTVLICFGMRSDM